MAKPKKPFWASRALFKVGLPATENEVYVFHTRQGDSEPLPKEGIGEGGGPVITPNPFKIPEWDEITTVAILPYADNAKRLRVDVARIVESLSSPIERSTRPILITSPHPVDLSLVDYVSRAVLKEVPGALLGFAFDVDPGDG